MESERCFFLFFSWFNPYTDRALLEIWQVEKSIFQWELESGPTTMVLVGRYNSAIPGEADFVCFKCFLYFQVVDS